jgi:hypothetical protein
LFKHFSGLERKSCPFQNLPESGKGRWGEDAAVLIGALQALGNQLREPRSKSLNNGLFELRYERADILRILARRRAVLVGDT